MSQKTKIMFSVLDTNEECMGEISATLALAASRISSAVVGERQEMTWNYDIASGRFSSRKAIEARLNEFLKAKAAQIRELSRRFRVEIDIAVADDGVPSVGHVSLSPQTLTNLAATGASLSVGFIGAENAQPK